jgi:hypothetical protein
MDVNAKEMCDIIMHQTNENQKILAYFHHLQ